LLQGLPKIIENWTKNGGAAQGMIPPVLQHGDVRSMSDDDLEEDEMNDDDDDSTHPNDEENENSSLPKDGMWEESESDEKEDADPLISLYDDVPVTNEFDPSPSAIQTKYKTHRLVKNPLALLMDEEQVVRHYQPSDSARPVHTYILNVNYAGNEAHESHLRVRLQCRDAKLDKLSADDLSDKYLKKQTSVISWLLYLGYLVWARRDS
jgi:hypothetical protein